MDDIFKLPLTEEIPYPALLTHPNVPKPLHGLNPRTVMGRGWWDEHRQDAYKRFGYRCWACGISKYEAAYHQWLEGHEHYDINYTTGRVVLSEIVALCHSCHNFIHSGRLWALTQKGEFPRDKAIYIVNRGVEILAQYRLEPFWGTLVVQAELNGTPMSDDVVEALAGDITVVDWSDWHIIIDGKRYDTPYASIEEWAEAYGETP